GDEDCTEPLGRYRRDAGTRNASHDRTHRSLSKHESCSASSRPPFDVLAPARYVAHGRRGDRARLDDWRRTRRGQGGVRDELVRRGPAWRLLSGPGRRDLSALRPRRGGPAGWAAG